MTNYINNKQNCVFFISHGCARTTFEWLREQGYLKLYYGDINRFKGLKIAVIRDPYKRIEAYYKSHLLMGISDTLLLDYQKQLVKFFPPRRLLDKSVGFEEFIYAVRDGYTDCGLEPQHKSMPVTPDMFAILENGLGILTSFLGFDISNCYLNRTDSINLTWNKKTRKIVNVLYAQDFILGGYSML